MPGAARMAPVTFQKREPTDSVGLRLPKTVVARLQAIADAEGVSRNAVAASLVMDALARYEAEHPPKGRK